MKHIAERESDEEPGEHNRCFDTEWYNNGINAERNSAVTVGSALAACL